MQFFWNKTAQNKKLLLEATSALRHLGDLQKELQNQKDKKILRQSDLWMIKNFTTGEDIEYRNVAAEVTFLEQKLLRVKELYSTVTIAIRDCQQDSSCDKLKYLLPLNDPFTGLDFRIPKVEYTLSRTRF